MSESNYEFLLSIAQSQSSIKFYAENIFEIITERRDVVEPFDPCPNVDNNRISIGDNTEKKSQSIVNQDFKVYPNPAKSEINLSLKNIELLNSVKITSLLGQEVYRKTINEGIFNGNITISSGNWSSGMYIVSLLDNYNRVIDSELLIIDK